MAKEKQWEDVRLLSFDLQTVEFTYASVRIALCPFYNHIGPLLMLNIGLHALHFLQGPTSHRRIVQPPL
jgi:hypothetical protein